MSWQAITRWTLRCDGRLAFGQCPNLVRVDPDGKLSDPDATRPRVSAAEREQRWPLVVWRSRELGPVARSGLRGGGWLVLPGGRVLCPERSAAAERQVRSGLERLPLRGFGPDPDGNGDGPARGGATEGQR